MSETKHTPGPWEYAGGDNYSVEINIGGATASLDRREKNTNELVMSREEMEASAKLIAAAPDLLEALEAMLSRFEHTDEGMVKADHVRAIAYAAIKKATT